MSETSALEVHAESKKRIPLPALLGTLAVIVISAYALSELLGNTEEFETVSQKEYETDLWGNLTQKGATDLGRDNNIEAAAAEGYIPDPSGDGWVEVRQESSSVFFPAVALVAVGAGGFVISKMRKKNQ